MSIGSVLDGWTVNLERLSLLTKTSPFGKSIPAFRPSGGTRPPHGRVGVSPAFEHAGVRVVPPAGTPERLRSRGPLLNPTMDPFAQGYWHIASAGPQD